MHPHVGSDHDSPLAGSSQTPPGGGEVSVRNSVRAARIGLWLGPMVGLAAFLLLPGGAFDVLGDPGEGALTPEARAVAAICALMAVWWITEPIPLPAVSLLPVVLLPLLGARTLDQAAAPYADRFIFLFLGGFILAEGIERWGLHRRFALRTVLLVGTQPRMMILGLMGATAFLSMWINNTSTAVMMLPIGLSVATLIAERGGRKDASDNFATCAVLGIAYAATIGGVATLIGTAPNVFLAGFIEETYGRDLGFLEWMQFGTPLAAVFLLATWALLTRVTMPVGRTAIPGGRDRLRDELRALGPMTSAQRRVLWLFGLAVVLWVSRDALAGWEWLARAAPAVRRLDDPIIAVLVAVLLFLTPSGRTRGEALMDWRTAVRLPWGVLLLFGGGLSLAAAMRATALDVWIGGRFHVLADMPAWVIVLVVVAAIVFLSEVASNTAVAAAFLPIIGGLAKGMGVDPLLLVIPAAVAASYAFMLPVGTPPNALAYATGKVSIPQMARAGLALNVMAIALITVSAFTLLRWAILRGL